MTESNEQSQAERMELPLTQDSNEPALSKHFPTILRSALEAALCHTLLHYRSAPISWYHCAAFWGCLVRQPPCHVGEF